ncbi:hypothetical protein ACLB2K_022926 [Fragaria x ananassa]
MTNEEFRRHYTGNKITPGLSSTSSNFTYQSLAASDIPTRMDWREQQAVTPIKDQGRCGACWAFSVAAAVEGLTKIKTGELISLSEQQLVDCSSQNNGCGGGSLKLAYDYVEQNGLAREESYPYEGTDTGTCNTDMESERAAKITSYAQVTSRDENDLLKAVAMQPAVSIRIAAYGLDFQQYSTGVFSGDYGTDLNHDITAIGYGTTEDGIDYWLMKNSWGTQWGESGFMKILRNSDAPEGMCGLAINNFDCISLYVYYSMPLFHIYLSIEYALPNSTIHVGS